MRRLLLAAVLFLLSEISFAKEKLNYTVTSDSQIQKIKCNFEAIGNVVIKRKVVKEQQTLENYMNLSWLIMKEISKNGICSKGGI